MICLIDTDLLISVIRGTKSARLEQREKALTFVDRCRQKASQGNEIALSVITAAELEFGARKSRDYERESEAIRKVLTPFRILDFTPECAREYGIVRSDLESSGVPIGAMDLLIGAHAKAIGATIVTNNVAHFGRIAGLRVENWWTDKA